VGIIAALMLALKQMWRGHGLKVCLVAALMLAILIKVAGSKVPDLVLVGVVLPASTSSLIIDFRAHYSMLRALYMVGATPRQVKSYMLVPPVVLSAIYEAPYVTMGIIWATLVFILSLASSLTVMTLMLHITKKGFSTFMVMYVR